MGELVVEREFVCGDHTLVSVPAAPLRPPRPRRSPPTSVPNNPVRFLIVPVTLWLARPSPSSSTDVRSRSASPQRSRFSNLPPRLLFQADCSPFPSLHIHPRPVPVLVTRPCSADRRLSETPLRLSVPTTAPHAASAAPPGRSVPALCRCKFPQFTTGNPPVTQVAGNPVADKHACEIWRSVASAAFSMGHLTQICGEPLITL